MHMCKLERLSTFAKYPNENGVYICSLVNAGFVYGGDGNTLTCSGCGFTCEKWTSMQQLLFLHQNKSSNCPYLSTTDENSYRDGKHKNASEIDNVKSSKHSSSVNEPSKTAAREQPGNANNNTCKSRPQEQRECINETPNSTPQDRPEHKKETLQSLGISFSRPKYPSYAILSSRTNSFSACKNIFPCTPLEMSRAGFFYAGYGDNVHCFCCGGGLSEWEKDDDPWEEHAHWFPNCVFLLQNKGAKFVQEVQTIVNSQGACSDPQNDRPNDNLENDLLTSTAALSVLEMGYSTEQVRSALSACSRVDQIRADEIVEHILQEEELKDGMRQSLGDNNQQQRKQNISESDREASVAKENKQPEQLFSKTASLTTDKHGSTNMKSNAADHTSSTAKYKQGEDISMKNNAIDLDDLRNIQREYRSLQDMTICKVCMDNSVSIVFLPCGHIVTCSDCAPAMRKCPLCREMVKGTIKAYLS